MFVEITELSKHDLGELTCKYRHIKKSEQNISAFKIELRYKAKYEMEQKENLV